MFLFTEVVFSFFISHPIFLISEFFTHGYTDNSLSGFFFIGIVSAVLVIISKNPVVSVLFLISLFASISCYLIILGLGFVGLSYLIVYIGAVSILFLFILMLINIRVSELQNNTYNTVALIVLMAIILSYPLLNLLPYHIFILNKKNSLNNQLLDLYLDNMNLLHSSKFKSDNGKLWYVSSNSWDSNLVENNHIVTIGNILYTNYNIWLLLVSIILLLAMVGCIVITLKSKNS